MNTIKLDKWDCAVIYYVKQSKFQTLHDIKKIWAERCGLDVEHITSQCLAEHFLPIVLDYGKLHGNTTYTAASIIVDAAPDSQWKFRDMGESVEPDLTQQHFNRFLTVLCSRLRLTEVKYLEGFDEYYNERKGIVTKLP